MGGQLDQQVFYFRPEDRVPTDHPLRGIKVRADAALRSISVELDGLYSAVRRPSIAPEPAQGQLLIATWKPPFTSKPCCAMPGIDRFALLSSFTSKSAKGR
jgi:hypothetical protein